jgi:hypothetical protein
MAERVSFSGSCNRCLIFSPFPCPILLVVPNCVSCDTVIVCLERCCPGTRMGGCARFSGSGLAGWVVHSVPHGAKISFKCIYIRSGRVTVAIYMSDPTIALYSDTGSVSTMEEGASVLLSAPGVMGQCASLVSKLDHRCVVRAALGKAQTRN